MFGATLAGGLVLTGLGWAACRWVARAWPRVDWALPVDLAGPFGLFAILFAATARPLFAGGASLAVFGGFAFADAVKRTTLLEPVVFSDMSEFIEIFRHPRLYLPFAGTGLVIGGFLAIVAALGTLLVVEPGQWRWSPWFSATVFALVLVIGIPTFYQPCLGAIARFARWLRPEGEPFADAKRLGPLAILPIYGAIARAERQHRRPPPPAPQIGRPRSTAPPIVMLQCESFFDARRLHPDMPVELLPAFDHCIRTGIQSGRFAVSGWGAYTVRAEFSALTGLDVEALGFDRWNPYHAFAKTPLPSLAWQLRDQGYRTLCLHPFDKRFYGRRKVMKALGFDEFWGEEHFADGERAGPYIADAELARRAAAILRDARRGLFLFAITMENHGPWVSDNGHCSLADPAPMLPTVPGVSELRRFLHGLKHTDEMLGAVCETLAGLDGGLVAAYGDHLPSLPAALKALGFTDSATDYAIWDARGGRGSRRDIGAHELPAALLAAQAALG
jgi:hypothetical protein